MEYESLLLDQYQDEMQESLGPLVSIDSTPRNVDESNEGLAVPDIWYLGTGGNLVFTAAVAAQLEPYLSLAGDLLPLRDVEFGRDFLMLSITHKKEPEQCLDVSIGSERRSAMFERLVAQAGDVISAEEAEELRGVAAAGDPWPYLLPAFKTEELGDDLTFFRLAGFRKTFVLDREDADDSILRRITELPLTGIAFESIWSSTVGHRDINLYDL